VERVRMEVLLKVGRGWVMYPMEVRVMPVVAPAVEDRRTLLPPVTARAGDAVYGPFRNLLCNARETGRDERLSVRRLIHRNAWQDLMLARSLESNNPDLRDEMLRRAGARDRAAWCKAPVAPAELGAEWFLRVRDLLYRQAGKGP
jgi:hypothetical protein